MTAEARSPSRFFGHLELDSERFVFPVLLRQRDRQADFWGVWNGIASAFSSQCNLWKASAFADFWGVWNGIAIALSSQCHSGSAIAFYSGNSQSSSRSPSTAIAFSSSATHEKRSHFILATPNPQAAVHQHG